MGSRELYIQPILEENLSVVPGMSEAMNTMTAQLNETTRILMNMMGNQGLQLNQQAYNGSAFSALTKTNSWGIFNAPYPAIVSVYDSTQYTCADNGVAFGNINKTSQDYTIGGNISLMLEQNEQYFAPATINWQGWASNGGSWYFKAAFGFKDGTGTGGYITSSTSSSGTTPCTISIPAEHQGKQITSASIAFVITGSAGTINANFGMPIFADENGNAKALINKRLKYLSFNSANAFTYYAAPTNSAISAAVMDIVYPQTAYITLPDIQNVGSWATFLTNGNIEGVNLAIVDNTSHDILLALPAKTSDITELTQTNNLALSVSMTSETQVINSIAQRYY